MIYGCLHCGIMGETARLFADSLGKVVEDGPNVVLIYHSKPAFHSAILQARVPEDLSKKNFEVSMLNQMCVCVCCIYDLLGELQTIYIHMLYASLRIKILLNFVEHSFIRPWNFMA